MGSGYVMNEYVLRCLKHAKDGGKEALEGLGTSFLIDVFGSNPQEDFVCHREKVADLVKELVTEDFKKNFGADYPFSVDVIREEDGTFKVAFFK